MESHIAIFPTPGMGHLIPLVEFAKKLVQKHNFMVNFIIPKFPTDGPLSNAPKSFFENLTPRIDYVVLPPANLDDLSEDVKIETRIGLTIAHSLSSLRDAVKSLISTKKFVAFVVDLFGTDAFGVANEFKIPPYIFFPSTAMCLSLFLNLSKLDESVSCEYRDMSEKVRIPGCMPIHGSDLLQPVQDRKNDAYKWVLHQSKRYRMAEGIVLNSFKELEPGTIEYLQEPETGKPSVYCIGPLIRMGSESENNEESACSKWLDEQPSGSVLYICFGSVGTLSHEQITEIAFGLEMSEQRFLWVLRSPSNTTANATYFSIQNSCDPLAYLPQGFLDRNKGRGLVVPSWAPQAQILSHGSTGGFLSHCGWNSTLESVVNGVPLIAWPLYAEQRMNTVMLTEDMKVALRPKFNDNGLVTRFEIVKIVKTLMEGEEGKEIQSRMRDLKDAAAKVLSDNGSSTKSLAEMVTKWKSESNVFSN
ncbi:hydroquinone glucosyltransferase-like [Olea europaea var. sylvestris]|uniref:Glycosyltransferase n=1 Tax=Olea europaea subsp. europaea TaxID=158383 RepID=A0A8S0UVB6_OLEEU|nr:hydroquinone glucosyltransferase-like [Olea europaea var. sylvestris]CAA3022049.1 hydroquinone glucosyltransferase-like [Olea europaea subsp. europaea]